MSSPLPEVAPPARWARLLAGLPNQKFAATSVAYSAAGLATRTELSGLVAANVEFTYRYYAQFAALRWTVARRRLHTTVDPDGAGHLVDAARRGNGVLLASVHLGDFDVVGSWLAQVMGLEVVVVVDAVAVGARQSSFDSVRRASGVILRRRDATRIADLEGDLRSGRVVLWMLDRTVRGPSLEGQLLGLPVLLPVAPYALAHRTGASLLCGVTTTRSDGRRKLFVRPRIDVGEYDAQTALLAIAEWLGDQIRQRPWQWHVPAELHQLTLFSACSQDGQPGSGEGAAAGRPASLAWG